MLLISESRVRANIGRMAARCRRHGLEFRPHFKTHQSLRVGSWFKEYGVNRIAVTSLRMALALEPGGWREITIATPLNPRELPAIAQLSVRTPITVFVTAEETARMVADLGVPSVGAIIELDAGYGRSGVDFRDRDRLQRMLEILGPADIRGFYVHSGHTYDAGSVAEIGRIHHELLAAVATVRAYDFVRPEMEFISGDTPSCSTQEDFSGLTALGPGNFVYYDLVQSRLGACRPEDIACCFAAPVLEVQPSRGRVVLHAGWVQLGKDQLDDGSYGHLAPLLDGEKNWGNVVPGAKMIKLSQEHGTAEVPKFWLERLRPGDMVGVLPVHACAAVHGSLALNERHFTP